MEGDQTMKVKNVEDYRAGANVPLVGDQILANAIGEVMDDRTSIVETGTYLGFTSLWFKESFPGIPFYTIENDRKYSSDWSSVIVPNVIMGNSSAEIKLLRVGDKPFFYLDAHWQMYWPLEDELKHISTLGNPIVFVHYFDDETGSQYDPGNDLNGPVGQFLKMRQDLRLYRLAGSHKVGVAVIATYLSHPMFEPMPPQSLYESYERDVL